MRARLVPNRADGATGVLEIGVREQQPAQEPVVGSAYRQEVCQRAHVGDRRVGADPLQERVEIGSEPIGGDLLAGGSDQQHGRFGVVAREPFGDGAAHLHRLGTRVQLRLGGQHGVDARRARQRREDREKPQGQHQTGTPGQEPGLTREPTGGPVGIRRRNVVGRRGWRAHASSPDARYRSGAGRVRDSRARPGRESGPTGSARTPVRRCGPPCARRPPGATRSPPDRGPTVRACRRLEPARGRTRPPRPPPPHR